MASEARRPQGIASSQTWQTSCATTGLSRALTSLAERIRRAVRPSSRLPADRPLAMDGWKGVPTELLIEIFHFLPLEDIPAVARVSRAWVHVIQSNSEVVWHSYALDFDQTVDSKRAAKLYKTGNIIGQAAWARIGDAGPIPQLSAEIANRLEAPCPFWPERRLIDTHLLIWIPKSVIKTVDGLAETIPVSLRNLPYLIPDAEYVYMSGFATAPHVDIPLPRGRWLLVPKEVIPGSKNQTFDEQQDLVAAQGREMPKAVEIAVALFMKHFLSPETYLLNRNPLSYTRCIDPVQFREGERECCLVVGSFSALGLLVYRNRLGGEYVGVVGIEEVLRVGF